MKIAVDVDLALESIHLQGLESEHARLTRLDWHTDVAFAQLKLEFREPLLRFLKRTIFR
jgi:hypothetical protein